ncbi:MAG TPA: hypothetical protein VFN88_05175 [Caulobacteraceae bacterium]|nr:hypothetical protein [Caulobacteraceae bacterium]
MKTKSILTAVLLATALGLPGSLAIAADQAAPALKAEPVKLAPGFKPTRMSWGAPDLEGTWTNVTVTPLERPTTYGDRRALTPDEVAKIEGRAKENWDYESKPTDPNAPAEDQTRKNCQGAGGRDCGYNAGWKDATLMVMRVGGEPRTSFITYPANGRIPPRIAATTGNARTRAAADQRERDQAAGEGGGAGRPGQNDNPEGRSLSERCIAFGNAAGPMLPNGYYNNNIKIVQGKDSVAIEIEMVHDVRVVRIGGTHAPDSVRRYFGDSIGHWEGDTLVVETTNYHPNATFRGGSANMKLTERFTRVAKDRLLYQFTVEDPTVWATAWKGEYEFYPTPGDLYEYACHEGNYGLEGILAGARNEERDAAAKAGRTANR